MDLSLQLAYSTAPIDRTEKNDENKMLVVYGTLEIVTISPVMRVCMSCSSSEKVRIFKAAFHVKNT